MSERGGFDLLSYLHVNVPAQPPPQRSVTPAASSRAAGGAPPADAPVPCVVPGGGRPRSASGTKVMRFSRGQPPVYRKTVDDFAVEEARERASEAQRRRQEARFHMERRLGPANVPMPGESGPSPPRQARGVVPAAGSPSGKGRRLYDSSLQLSTMEPYGPTARAAGVINVRDRSRYHLLMQRHHFHPLWFGMESESPVRPDEARREAWHETKRLMDLEEAKRDAVAGPAPWDKYRQRGGGGGPPAAPRPQHGSNLNYHHGDYWWFAQESKDLPTVGGGAGEVGTGAGVVTRMGRASPERPMHLKEAGPHFWFGNLAPPPRETRKFYTSRIGLTPGDQLRLVLSSLAAHRQQAEAEDSRPTHRHSANTL